MRLRVDPETCIGAGQCVITAPEIFDQDDDEGTVVLLQEVVGAADEDRVRVAVASCPSGAIAIEDD